MDRHAERLAAELRRRLVERRRADAAAGRDRDGDLESAVRDLVERDAAVLSAPRRDQLRELVLHGRVAFPARNGGSQIQVLPFGMETRLGLQLGKALEQIVNEARNAPGALVLPRPVEHGQDRRDCDGLDRAAFRDERRIVARLELGRDVVFLQARSERHRQELETLRPPGFHESVQRLGGDKNDGGVFVVLAHLGQRFRVTLIRIQRASEQVVRPCVAGIQLDCLLQGAQSASEIARVGQNSAD